jgi:hypothetical protein
VPAAAYICARLPRDDDPIWLCSWSTTYLQWASRIKRVSPASPAASSSVQPPAVYQTAMIRGAPASDSARRSTIAGIELV